MGIAVGSAYLGKWRGILTGHFIIALLVACLDAVYQSQHMAQMDVGMVFSAGVLSRILLINTILLPASAVGLLMAFHRRKLVKSAV